MKSSFSFSKQLNYEVWKEIIHFWHWAVISSHSDTRNWSGPFDICPMLSLVQHSDNLKDLIKNSNLENEKWQKKINSKSGEQVLALKNHLPRTETKISASTPLWGLERNYSFLALGSDILTPWHQKLNWPFWHLSHAIYSPAFR